MALVDLANLRQRRISFLLKSQTLTRIEDTLWRYAIAIRR
jgi:hypothetical protein